MNDANVRLVEHATVTTVHSIPGGFSCGVFDEKGQAEPFSVHRPSTRNIAIFPSVVDADTPATSFDAALYGGLFFNHYGHFIMESLGRLWLANVPQYRDLPIVVQAPWGDIDLQNRDGFVRTVLDLLEIDAERIVVLTGAVRVDYLHVPEQLYGFNEYYDKPPERFIDFLRVAQKNILDITADFTPPSDRVFISRSEWQEKYPKRGLVAGAQQFDTFLRGEGWHVIQPETLTLKNQLRIYATARHVLMLEGSAQHSYIFLPDTTARVTVMLRRPDPWDVTRVTKQFGGLGTPVFTLQRIEKTYFFGQPSWSGLTVLDYSAIVAALAETGDVVSTFTAWGEVREEEIRRCLRTYIEAIRNEPSFLDFMLLT